MKYGWSVLTQLKAEKSIKHGLVLLSRPMSSQGFEYPCRVSCDFKGKKGLILLDQIRAVDKARLIKKLGVLDKETQIKLCHTLQEMFAF